MRIAVLLQCHKNLQQIRWLVETLQHPSVDIYVHIDKKSHIAREAESLEGVFLLPDPLRVDVQWGKLSQVDATLHLLEYARSGGPYDYYWLISGQDVLLKDIDAIVYLLEQDKTASYMEASPSVSFRKRCELYYPQWMIGGNLSQRICRRLYQELTGGRRRTFPLFLRRRMPVKSFYFGSSWWCLTGDAVAWILEYLQDHPDYRTFFHGALCPDEVFFQTLFMHSPCASNRRDKLCYVKWSGARGGHPEVLTMSDLPNLLNTSYVIARKFDADADRKVILALMNRNRDTKPMGEKES